MSQLDDISLWSSLWCLQTPVYGYADKQPLFKLRHRTLDELFCFVLYFYLILRGNRRVLFTVHINITALKGKKWLFISPSPVPHSPPVRIGTHAHTSVPRMNSPTPMPFIGVADSFLVEVTFLVCCLYYVLLHSFVPQSLIAASVYLYDWTTRGIKEPKV